MVRGKEGGFGSWRRQASQEEWPQARTRGIVDSPSKGWRQTGHSGNSGGSMASFSDGPYGFYERQGK